MLCDEVDGINGVHDLITVAATCPSSVDAGGQRVAVQWVQQLVGRSARLQ
jgi:hypothetical protein